MTRIYAVSALALVAALLGATGYMILSAPSGSDQFAECRSSVVSGGAGSIGGPFTLENTRGQTVTNMEVITEPSLLYFGYTFCPDICPLDAARNAEAVDILEEMGITAQPVFISIDPERDTPDVLADFTANMHPRMVGLTGTAEQVKAASTAYRTYYKKEENGDPEYYLMDHSTYSYLVLPDHGFVEFYPRDIGADAMAKSVACFAEKAG
jgi:protein SCO1/2